jgi:hypothetical protein
MIAYTFTTPGLEQHMTDLHNMNINVPNINLTKVVETSPDENVAAFFIFCCILRGKFIYNMKNISFSSFVIKLTDCITSYPSFV